MAVDSSSPASGLEALESTPRLFDRARLGDTAAVGELFGRYLPELKRWAHGRLPQWARSIADTADLVQDTVLRTLGRLDRFDPRGRRALAAYLRQAVRNRIRDEHRRVARHELPQPLSETLVDRRPSPLDRAITNENETRYRAAVSHLSPTDQELI